MDFRQEIRYTPDRKAGFVHRPRLQSNETRTRKGKGKGEKCRIIERGREWKQKMGIQNKQMESPQSQIRSEPCTSIQHKDNAPKQTVTPQTCRYQSNLVCRPSKKLVSLMLYITGSRMDMGKEKKRKSNKPNPIAPQNTVALKSPTPLLKENCDENKCAQRRNRPWSTRRGKGSS